MQELFDLEVPLESARGPTPSPCCFRSQTSCARTRASFNFRFFHRHSLEHQLLPTPTPSNAQRWQDNQDYRRPPPLRLKSRYSPTLLRSTPSNDLSSSACANSLDSKRVER